MSKSPPKPPSMASMLALGAAFLLASAITMVVAWRSLSPSERPAAALIEQHQRLIEQVHASSSPPSPPSTPPPSLVIPALEGATQLRVISLPGPREPKTQVLWRAQDGELISMFLAPAMQPVAQWRCRPLQPSYTLCERTEGAQRVTLLSSTPAHD